jgi:hypothetical protein
VGLELLAFVGIVLTNSLNLETMGQLSMGIARQGILEWAEVCLHFNTSENTFGQHRNDSSPPFSTMTRHRFQNNRQRSHSGHCQSAR